MHIRQQSSDPVANIRLEHALPAPCQVFRLAHLTAPIRPLPDYCGMMAPSDNELGHSRGTIGREARSELRLAGARERRGPCCKRSNGGLTTTSQGLCAIPTISSGCTDYSRAESFPMDHEQCVGHRRVRRSRRQFSTRCSRERQPVPVVNRRDPRALRSDRHESNAAARAGGAC